MRIYVDIDDVVTETARTLCRFAADMFGRRVPYEKVFEFDLQVSFSLDDRQIRELMDFAHSPESLASYPETPGATATVASWIAGGHDVTFVTGRPASTHEGTVRWLSARGLGGARVIHVDKFRRETSSAAVACDYVVPLRDFLGMRFDFAVEDSPVGLGLLAKIPGCRVAVFNRPWNARAEFPPGRFTRCRDWAEIDALLQASAPASASPAPGLSPAPASASAPGSALPAPFATADSTNLSSMS